MLTTAQLDAMGNALGTPILGANPSIPTSYSGAQMNSIIANQLVVHASSRSADMQLQTMNWINEVVPQITSAGTVNKKYHDRRPAASTALNSIIEHKLSTLRKTRIDFFLTHVDLLLMMRCRHGELKLSRFLAREPGVKKPLDKFPDTRTGLVMFLTAMKRAKSLEIGVTDDHLSGWTYLTKLGDDLLERGFALARPQDFFDFVQETFVVFSYEHRDAVSNARDISDYPTSDKLDDADETVQPAHQMLTGGNVMRKQVDKIDAAQLALMAGYPWQGQETPCTSFSYTL
jgi:hypothetical protein